MRLIICCLLLSASAFAAERFKINTFEVRQITGENTALCVLRGELVFISGLDFTQTRDGALTRSNCHATFDGNYTYNTLIGTRTVRKVQVLDNGSRR